MYQNPTEIFNQIRPFSGKTRTIDIIPILVLYWNKFGMFVRLLKNDNGKP